MTSSSDDGNTAVVNLSEGSLLRMEVLGIVQFPTQRG